MKGWEKCLIVTRNKNKRVDKDSMDKYMSDVIIGYHLSNWWPKFVEMYGLIYLKCRHMDYILTDTNGVINTKHL